MSGMGRETRCQSRRRTSGTVSGSRSAARSSVGSSPDDDLAECGEVGVRQHGQGDVAVPAGPGADLVLIQADLALGGLEAGLDRPARAGDLDEVGECGAVGGMGQVEGELPGWAMLRRIRGPSPSRAPRRRHRADRPSRRAAAPCHHRRR